MAEGGGKKRPLQKAKHALKALLKEKDADEEEEEEEEVDCDSSDQMEGGGADDKTGGADGKAEATEADLEKEGQITDARQLLSREKAKAAQERKTQSRLAALALKEKKDAEKAAGGAKAAGLRKRKAQE